MDKQDFESDETSLLNRDYKKKQSNINKKYSTIDVFANVDKSHLHTDIHIISLEELYKRFQTNPEYGLSSEQANELKKTYGPNIITPPPSPNYFKLVLRQAFKGFNTLLWIAALFAILAWKPFGLPNPDIANLATGILLGLVILLNAALNCYQEVKSIKIVASYSKLIPQIATVKRNATEQQILSNDVVPGDIVLLRSGAKIPGDCRIISSDGLKVNNSDLTGESKPVSCTVQCTSENFMETTNICYYSSTIVQGNGIGLIICTGDNTVLGEMSQLTRETGADEMTGLHREVNRFLLFVVSAAVITIILIWISWALWLNVYHKGFRSANDILINSVELTVAYLPLGLPAAITLALTIVATLMYNQHVLVKGLQIVEMFNSVSVIATDKTGTLTQNKMTVTHVLWDINGVYKVPDTDHVLTKEATVEGTLRRLSTIVIDTIRRISSGTINTIKRLSSGDRSSKSERLLEPTPDVELPLEISEMKIRPFQDLLLGAVLCNNAEKQLAAETELEDDLSKMKSKLKLVGDAVDTALYNLCADKCFIDVEKVRQLNPRLKVLPFNSTNKFLITANRLETTGTNRFNGERTVLITLKGAPDIVISKCTTYKTSNKEILPLTPEIRQILIDRQEKLGKHGYRVIAMCHQKLLLKTYDEMMLVHKEHETEQEDMNGFPTGGYCFIGLFSLLDPPRPEVPDAVSKARQAHIRVAMVTGDHSTTAQAIAKQCNILTPEIADFNGIDRFELNDNNAVDLYRNDKVISQHKLDEVKVLDASVVKSTMRLSFNDEEVEKYNILERFWRGFRSYFSDPMERQQHEKRPYIPYAIVVKGSELSLMDDFMWEWTLSHQEIVFARTSPEQKLRIVIELEKYGEIIAVTGDGTNDGPALKRAHLGIAMQSGTDVSKEASDMILMDNNFASITQAIETGRLLNDNLKKVAIYLLPGGTWSQIWPVLFSIWLGIPLALSAFLATVFCMLNDVFMSLAMVNEKAESDIMSRPPAVRHKDHLLNGRLLFHAYAIVGTIECFAGFFCYFWYYTSNGIPLSSIFFTYEKFGREPYIDKTPEELAMINRKGQCIYYCSICLMQYFNYFTTRTRYTSFFKHNPFYGKARNRTVFVSMILSAGVQILVTQVHWFNRIFHTAPVPVIYVLPTLGFGFALFCLDELRKLYVRKYPKSPIAEIAW